MRLNRLIAIPLVAGRPGKLDGFRSEPFNEKNIQSYLNKRIELVGLLYITTVIIRNWKESRSAVSQGVVGGIGFQMKNDRALQHYRVLAVIDEIPGMDPETARSCPVRFVVYPDYAILF